MSKKRAQPFKNSLTALAVASCLGGISGLADAAGMGRLTVLSALGQPLSAEIDVSAVKEELPGMAARLAHPDAFKAVGIDYASILTNVKMALDKRPNGQVFIKITSDRPVADPFLDVLVELTWSSGRLVREYTVLLDPPDAVKAAPPAPPPVVAAAALAPAPTVVAESAPTPAPVAEPTPAPAPAQAPAAEKAPTLAKEAPAAAGKKRAATEAADGGSRTVKSGDTLGKIAKELKPEGVTLDQMLVGLFRANPDAFSGKNMNRLKAGKILAVPSAAEIESAAPAEARKEVLAQASDWNAYRRKLAGVAAQAPAAEAAAPKEAAGKITAKVEDKTPVKAETKDQVKVSKTETPVAAAPVAGGKKPAEEDKVAKERALKESADRAAQLEKNVADLQKLVEMKNQSLAQAQAKGAAPAPAKPAEPAKPAVAPAPVPAPAPAPAVAAPKPAEPAKPAEAAKPADAAKPAEPAKPAEAAKPAEPAKPAEAPKPQPKPIAPPPEEEESILANPAIWGGLAALLGGIGGLIFYRRRKAAKSGEGDAPVPALGEPSLGANSVFRATGGQSVDTSAATPAVTDFSQTGPGTIDTDEVDPVAEAEVYMAYGRDAQAEEILLEALQKDSKRLAIHLKLLEIYAQRKSAKQFETLATELYAQTGGAGPEWEKAVAMGSKLDPANPLYSGGGAAPAPGQPFAEASSFDPDATAVVPRGVAATRSTVAMPGALSQMAGAATAGGLGSLGEALGQAPSLGNESTTRLDAPLAQPVAGGMDFDLGSPNLMNTDVLANALNPENTMVFGGTPATPAVPAEPAPLNVDISFDLPGQAPAASTPALDFDLGLGSSTDIAGGAASPSGGLDFDLGLSASKFDAGIAMEPASKPDMSAINLDLGAPAADGDFGSTLFVTPGLAQEMGSAPDDAKVQEVATKLDLAKAYEEMGDAEGARELLQEVMNEGSAEQKDAAGAILKRLG